MVMDRNKKFGADTKFAEDARRVGNFLWDNTGGDVTAFPRSYLEISATTTLTAESPCSS
jgi:hypothetical protein